MSQVQVTQVEDSNPPRVVVFGDKDAHEIRLHNPKAIAKALAPAPPPGEHPRPVLGAVLKCFMGVERIVTFEHLIYLNNQAEKNPGIEADEHSFSRNNMILAMMLVGTMYEMGEALQDLFEAKVPTDPALREAWEPLDKLRCEWHREDYAKKIRNKFVFHLGEPRKYEKGVTNLAAEPAILFETTGGKRPAGRYRATWDALFKAHEIEDEDMRPFVDRTYKAHSALPELMFTFFYQLLKHRGVQVSFEEAK